MTNDDQTLPPCPKCDSEYTYETGALLTCPMCAHEWSPEEPEDAGAEGEGEEHVVRDAVGNELVDGDAVIVVQTVRIAGGGGGSIRAGTKVRGIRLVEDTGDGHDLEARVGDFGRVKLKSSIVRRA